MNESERERYDAFVDNLYQDAGKGIRRIEEQLDRLCSAVERVADHLAPKECVHSAPRLYNSSEPRQWSCGKCGELVGVDEWRARGWKLTTDGWRHYKPGDLEIGPLKEAKDPEFYVCVGGAEPKDDV